MKAFLSMFKAFFELKTWSRAAREALGGVRLTTWQPLGNCVDHTDMGPESAVAGRLWDQSQTFS